MAGLSIRLELVDPAHNHNKFWAVEMHGPRLFVMWGRIGTKGQIKEFVLGNEGHAYRVADEKILEKLHKGYKVVSRSDDRYPEKATEPESAPEPAPAPDSESDFRARLAEKVKATWGDVKVA